MQHWSDFGVGQLPSFSARKRVEFPPPIQALLGERAGAVERPLEGLTSDGTLRLGLFPLRSTGVSTAPITDAASDFLSALSAEQRQRAVFPLDARERRMWLNVHPFLYRHGVMLEDLAPATRQLGLRLLEAGLSARGFAQARDIMRLNRLLAEVTGFHDDFGEWPYFLSFYGEPSTERPWAWQIDGHHLCLNGTVIGDQFLLTPSFMGSEPCQVFDGPLAGTMVFTPEERAGQDLIRSLDDQQAAQAVLRPSIHPDDLPPELQDPFDGRMQAGAFRDNAIVAYAGVCGLWLPPMLAGRARAILG
jgi:hypothetical protein